MTPEGFCSKLIGYSEVGDGTILPKSPFSYVTKLPGKSVGGFASKYGNTGDFEIDKGMGEPLTSIQHVRTLYGNPRIRPQVGGTGRRSTESVAQLVVSNPKLSLEDQVASASFSLQSLQFVDRERVRPTVSQDNTIFVQAPGRSPRELSVSGTLLNNENYEWFRSWLYKYDSCRASAAAKSKEVHTLIADGIQYRCIVLGTSTQQVATKENAVPFTMNLLVLGMSVPNPQTIFRELSVTRSYLVAADIQEIPLKFWGTNQIKPETPGFWKKFLKGAATFAMNPAQIGNFINQAKSGNALESLAMTGASAANSGLLSAGSVSSNGSVNSMVQQLAGSGFSTKVVQCIAHPATTNPAALVGGLKDVAMNVAKGAAMSSLKSMQHLAPAPYYNMGERSLDNAPDRGLLGQMAEFGFALGRMGLDALFRSSGLYELDFGKGAEQEVATDFGTGASAPPAKQKSVVFAGLQDGSSGPAYDTDVSPDFGSDVAKVSITAIDVSNAPAPTETTSVGSSAPPSPTEVPAFAL